MAYGEPKDSVTENNLGTGVSASIRIPGRFDTTVKATDYPRGLSPVPLAAQLAVGPADGESKERNGSNKRSYHDMEHISQESD